MARQIRIVEKISDKYEKLASPGSGAKMRASIGLDKNVGEYIYIKTENIEPYDKQARKLFDQAELEKMAETIKIYGIRNPLTVIKGDNPGFFKVVSGERRLRAAKIAGLERVPCIILDQHDLAEEVAVIENIQRSDLHPIELSSAYSALLKDFNYGDQTKLAHKLGVSNSHLSEVLTLHKLSGEIKEYLLQNNIRTRSSLRKIMNETNLQTVKQLLGKESGYVAKMERRKFAVRIYFNGESAIIAGVQKKMTSSQKNSLLSQLKNLIDNLER